MEPTTVNAPEAPADEPHEPEDSETPEAPSETPDETLGESEDEAPDETEDSEKSETADTEEEAEPEEPEAAEPEEQPTSRRTAALVLAVLALLSAAWFGWSWYGAAHDESLRFSETRDEVLRAGEQAVLNLNTLDYRDLNTGLKLWQDSSTSELYQQIVQGRAAFEREVKKAKTITSAKVLDAAVTELDQHAGKASVIVGVQITVTPPKGEPVVKKTRLMGELTRTATGWKLSALAQAPAGATG
ncbi:hypothetical protein Acsp03_32240 [Actinomadura sp. NBRC 104412]|uniref:hypothetical protein n=1 Tax=Actinomadura sp. NBRC 104412 TaxID=3032203 RepID=UPI0024A3B41F|nr:hypothetical protein [Actinomadura sp. NBRC 104412]GLZ05758.1 hypothetical protein Acsp03_32240 [Actinomadura sp. NBRC 104412]